MYQVWIPIYNRVWTPRQLDELAEQLRIAKVDLVLLTCGRILCNEEMRRTECEMFRKNKEFLEAHGFAVGAWLAPTIGYGMPFYGDNEAATDFTHIRRLRSEKVPGSPGMELDRVNFGLSEGETPGAYCPLDARFADEFMKMITALVRLGVKTVMLEDDFTLGGGKFWQDIGCACDRHLADYARRTGERLTRAELSERIFTGGRNRHRDAWMEMQRDTLMDFTKRIEREVHAIDPAVRLGLSANGSSFEMEGVTIDELEMALAGDTKPFLRLTGAPYWKQMMTVAPTIESIRLQSVWCDRNKIELVTEGDTYPRPRHWISSALLEGYDMILRADGYTHTILKYMLDYNSSPTYETGYVERHAANRAHYEEIERRFGGRRTVGLCLYERPMTFADRIFDGDVSISNFRVRCGGYMPLASQWMLCDNSIPITYEEDGSPMMVVGENAQYLTREQLKRGVILDAQAAKRLFERGIDIGVTSMERVQNPFCEYYPTEDQYTLASVPADGVFYDMKLKSGAVVDSEFVITEPGLGVIPPQGLDGKRRFPACYCYENADGEKFAVYSFLPESVATTNEWIPGIFRGYCRQRQLGRLYEFLAGRPLPAMCYGAPELYVLCKRGEDGSLAVGLWNLFADSVLRPTIELDGIYTDIDCYRCNGKIDGTRVRLEEEIPPFGFAFFTVKK